MMKAQLANICHDSKEVPTRGVPTKFWLEGMDSCALNPLPTNSNLSPDFGHFIFKILENLKKW